MKKLTDMTWPLRGTASLLIGIIVGLAALGAVGLLFPSLFINLGLHGTIVSVLATPAVMIPWLKSRHSLSLSERSKVVSLLLKAFVVGTILGILIQVGFIFFGGPNPEMMTWGDKVVISGGRKTLAGWVLDARGCLENGLASLILSGCVVSVSLVIDRIKRRS